MQRALCGAAGALVFSLISGTAWAASPACDALRQSPVSIVPPRNGSSAFPGILISAGPFSAGDRITATITGGSATFVNITAAIGGNATSIATKSPVAAGDVLAGTIPQGPATFLRFIHTGATNITATITCGVAASGSTNTNTDSQKAKALQIIGSTLVSQNSGAAISGAIDEAIADAFGAGNFFTGGPNNVLFNFAAEPKSDVQRRTDDAFAALGYAGVTKAPPRAPAPDRHWSLWANVRGTGFDRDDASGFDGTQINVTAGFGYKLTPDLLVGLFGGYETFDYDMRALSGKFEGDGGTIGGYASWRFAPTLRWDAALGWSRIGYDASAGAASGSFDGSRWLLSTGLTGTYKVGAYIFEPSAKVFALWESQDAWTDSLGTLQTARDFSAGRFSAGGKAIAPFEAYGLAMSPWLGVYADWYFGNDTGLPAGSPVLVGIGEGWAGRVAGGLNFRAPNGRTLGLSGEYGGIGADFKVWTANARAAWPF